MATLDLWLLGLVLLVAVAGAFSGALRQVLKLAGVVAGWAAARWLAPLTFPALGVQSAGARALVTAATFLAAWLLVAWLGRSIQKAVQGKDQGPGAVDRLLGALLGAAKGALVAWVFLSLLALGGGRLTLGSVRIDDRGSQAAALAARHDLLALADPEAARSLRRLSALWRDPSKRARLLQDPDWKRLLERTGLGAALEKGAGAAGDGAAALEKARGKAQEALDEKELRRLLDKAEVE